MLGELNERTISTKEVKEAMNEIKSDKASGLNGKEAVMAVPE